MTPATPCSHSDGSIIPFSFSSCQIVPPRDTGKGLSLGDTVVGVDDGFLLGDEEGDCDGALEGLAVLGDAEGDCVGGLDGLEVGLPDGALEGLTVGRKRGDAVGASVAKVETKSMSTSLLFICADTSSPSSKNCCKPTANPSSSSSLDLSLSFFFFFLKARLSRFVVAASIDPVPPSSTAVADDWLMSIAGRQSSSAP